MVPACFLALVSLYFGCVSHKNSLLPRSTLVTALLQQPKLNKTGNEEVFFFLMKSIKYAAMKSIIHFNYTTLLLLLFL